MHPLNPTYPKRAKQLVKQGRARWLDDDRLQLIAGSPLNTGANDNMDELLKQLLESNREVMELLKQINARLDTLSINVDRVVIESGVERVNIVARESVQVSVEGDVGEVSGNVDELNGDVDEVNGDVDSVHGGVDSINGNVDEVNGDVNEINH